MKRSEVSGKPDLPLSPSHIRALKKQININFMGETQRFAIGSDNTPGNLSVSEPIPVLGTPVFSGIRIAQIYSKCRKKMFRELKRR
jgi:hypothetical protein